MKTLMLAFLLIPLFAHAGPEACEPLARAQAQNSITAYIYNAETFHDASDAKYLACIGQQLRYVSVTQEINEFGYPYYAYHYAIECGPNTITLSEEYYLQNGCQIRGE